MSHEIRHKHLWPLGYHIDNKSPLFGMAIKPTNHNLVFSKWNLCERPEVGRLKTDDCNSLYKDTFLLTLTFRALFHYQGPKGLFNKTIDEIAWNMHKIARADTFRIFPELTNKGVLHYHILYKTRNFVTLKAFRNYWFRKYGNTDIEVVGHTQRDFWTVFHYIRKDSRAMIKFFKLKKYSQIPNLILNQARFKRRIPDNHAQMCRQPIDSHFT